MVMRLDQSSFTVPEGITGPTSFSISVWVRVYGVAAKQADTSMVQPVRTILEQDSSSCDGSFALSIDTTGMVKLTYTSSGGGWSATGGASITNGAWHHIAFVNEASTPSMILYVDGSVADQSSSNAMSTIGCSEMVVGRNATTAADYLDGWIDNLVVRHPRHNILSNSRLTSISCFCLFVLDRFGDPPSSHQRKCLSSRVGHRHTLTLAGTMWPSLSTEPTHTSLWMTSTRLWCLWIQLEHSTNTISEVPLSFQTSKPQSHFHVICEQAHISTL